MSMQGNGEDKDKQVFFVLSVAFIFSGFSEIYVKHKS
jgi:hypothetical protein